MNGCGFGYDDGAYVLGALSSADRAAYQRHLPGCPSCQRAVGQLAALPGLLSRLDPTMLAAVAEGAPKASADRDRLPALLAAARLARRRERLTNRWRYASSLLIAVALALLVGLGVPRLRPGEAGPEAGGEVQLVSMTPVRDETRVSAEIGLRGTGWGTEITMRCRYPAGPGAQTRRYAYLLVAYGPGGASEQVGSWVVGADQEVTVRGATRLAGPELIRLELARSDGTPLLRYYVP